MHWNTQKCWCMHMRTHRDTIDVDYIYFILGLMWLRKGEILPMFVIVLHNRPNTGTYAASLWNPLQCEIPQVRKGKRVQKTHISLQFLSESEKVWLLIAFHSVKVCILRTHSHMYMVTQAPKSDTMISGKGFWLNSVFIDPLSNPLRFL